MGSIEVYVKLLCVDVPPEKSRGTIFLPDAATVEEALETYAGAYSIDIPISEFKKSMFLINKTTATLDSALNEGDVLTVMRTLSGG